MSDHGKHSQHRENSQRGDSQIWIGQMISRRGHQTLTSFCNEHPTMTIGELAEVLGMEDVAPIQILWMLVDEALASNTVRECAQSLLIRFLHRPAGGWPSGNGWDEQKEIRFALTTWEGSFPEEAYRSSMKAMTDALLDSTDIPAGWLPSGIDDPRIAALFDRFWPTSEQSQGLE
jgi:hypothetical protein